MKKIQLFQSLIKKAQNIVISTHLHPDADGIGSEIALCRALTKAGKTVSCVNEEPLMDRYRYLDPEFTLISYDDFMANPPFEDIDLFIVVDTNALARIGTNVQKIVTKARNLLFIDHHPCPKELAAIHCIDTTMAATGELVGRLIQSLGITFDKEMALALYTSILIDTSSFRYPTVTAQTHRLIGDLMDTGIEPPMAYNSINGTKKITYMQMLGIVLSRAKINQNESVAYLTVSEDLMEQYGVDPEDTHGFVNFLLILDNIKVACMFRQTGKNVKISLRSAGDVDVGVMAQALGGGGHNHSAATVIEGKMSDVVDETIQKIEMMLSHDDS